MGEEKGAKAVRQSLRWLHPGTVILVVSLGLFLCHDYKGGGNGGEEGGDEVEEVMLVDKVPSSAGGETRCRRGERARRGREIRTLWNEEVARNELVAFLVFHSVPPKYKVFHTNFFPHAFGSKHFLIFT
ncbi:hypothetical protein QVD17_24995 [Tagetes erecta]|uniref:Uncharacterized protein n=1 Tax=Tagetes erecta TaxID=13708 RepID=A0AAD8KG82_TARER|nr:hypothetical protein QVD17_24995 [Tagetes erecta]